MEEKLRQTDESVIIGEGELLRLLDKLCRDTVERMIDALDSEKEC